ncbi:hypothetical protein F0562_007265 [Nyssa sinensis]|uniref:CCHC-type domain-containing protein n=1 Tax=Nyssa sinensis TaxID=561372 RepID=A0A5J5A7S7_9ASTE|nr:hypothetical protein F0562_007265 [Nyssa sinensis]
MALVGAYTPNQSRQGNSQQDRPICQICGKTGHVTLDWYHRMNYSYQGKTPPAHLTAMATSYEHHLPINNLWLTDSGASNHIISDMSNLNITKDYNGDELVSIGSCNRANPT